VLRQVPNCSENQIKVCDCSIIKIDEIKFCSLQQFDDKLMSQSNQKLIPEKRKKDSFKKLVQEIIGVSITYA
jgi:hypothetical protein